MSVCVCVSACETVLGNKEEGGRKREWEIVDTGNPPVTMLEGNEQIDNIL